MSTIRPTNPAAVNIGSGSNMGMGSTMGSTMGGVAGGGASQAPDIRNFLNHGIKNINRSSGGNAGFNWGSTNKNSNSDESLLRRIRGEGTQEELNNFYVERVTEFIKVAIQQMIHGRGALFNHFRKVLDIFRYSGGIEIKCLAAFVDDVNKQLDFRNIIAFPLSTIFGSILIEEFKRSDDKLTEAAIFGALEAATREVLFYEFISWLMYSDNGRVFVANLPANVSRQVNQLQRYKEITNNHFAKLSVDNPYANLEFKIPTVTSPVLELATEETTNYIFNNEFISTPPNANITTDDLTRMVMERASGSRRGIVSNNVTQSQPEVPNSHHWDNTRNDLENINSDNIKEFDFYSYFKPVKNGVYIVLEGDFKYLKNVMEPKKGTYVEDNLNDSIRIVKVDLMSGPPYLYETILIKGRITLERALSNPKELLPELEDPNGLDDVWAIYNSSVDIIDKDTEVTLEELGVFKPVENGITSVKYKTKVTAKTYSEATDKLSSLNEFLTRGQETTAAVIGMVAYSSYKLNSTEEKDAVVDSCKPFFKGYKDTGNFKKRLRYAKAAYNQGRLPEGLYMFLESHLTRVVNNWLVNSMGYRLKRENGAYVKIKSVFDDIDSLYTFAQNGDEQMLMALEDIGDNFLNRSLQIFTSTDSFADANDPLAVANKDKTLYVERDVLVATINNISGPTYDGEPLIVSKSSFPEYFELFKDAEEYLIPGIDSEHIHKLVYFAKTKSLFLFSKTEGSETVGKMRPIDSTSQLVLMEQL